MSGLHLPVMTEEVTRLLITEAAGTYVDCTLGDGGHALAIMQHLKGRGRLIGLDWDAQALKRAASRLAGYQDKMLLVKSSYTALEEVLKEAGIEKVSGVLIDLGASTLQLLDPGRGFSTRCKGALDMRMDQSLKLTAKEIVNHYSAQELTDIFYRYGEERFARRIAGRLVKQREEKGPITGTVELAELVKEAIPARFRRQGRHPARRVFQALRIEVNSELKNIEQVLPAAVKVLKPGGRLCVIAYHSLEDRLVKRFFAQEAQGCRCPKERPCICGAQAVLKIITGKALKASLLEIENNPRSRSARLRVAEKV